MESAALAELKGLQQSLRRIEKALAAATKAFSSLERTPIEGLEKVTTALQAALATAGDRARLDDSRAFALSLTQQAKTLREERSDVDRRRRRLAEAAQAAGWPIEHTGAKDFVGPFTVQHRPSDSTIGFGTFRLQKLKVPSGEEVMAALSAHKLRLEDEAKRGWEEFLAAAVAAQLRISASEPVPWPAVVAEVIPDQEARRKAAKTLLYRLSMLLSGSAPGNRRVQIVPPTLSEQRTAVTVPKLNRANDDVRVYRIRLN